MAETQLRSSSSFRNTNSSPSANTSPSTDTNANAAATVASSSYSHSSYSSYSAASAAASASASASASNKLPVDPSSPSSARSNLNSNNLLLHQRLQQQQITPQKQRGQGSQDLEYRRQHSNDGGSSTSTAQPLPRPRAQNNNNNIATTLSPPGGRFTEEWDASQRGSSIIDGPGISAIASATADMQRSASTHSYATGDDQQLPLRNNTLKKKASMHRVGSLGRSSSRRSNRAGSVKSLGLHSTSDRDPDESRSAFHCPVPTSGSPTEVLVDRFQTWRKVLKDLISYFREIQSHYEHKSKSLLKLANVSNNIQTPATFLSSAGIDDALQFLRNYNKAAIQEANKAKDIEEDVILALTGLRSDLQQKIKEIKHLSGDFKNSVDKEMEHTSKAVRTLSEMLTKGEDDSSTNGTGRQDPFLLRLAVDRQVERQVDEENYLHQAYLNLEGSGRELESIVVGEIQKAYNAYAGILKREADNSLGVIEELRDGPVAMPKDQEWIHFVTHDERVVDPTIPLRSADQIHYPGQDHLSAQEIRAGLLERKSKYLKSYTAGWYVLSTTHLHEFKSADKGQAPIMSLYLQDQKLGSHSSEGGSSNKFILKGRQTGTMHRGHTWVFRAESHDTMIAWYEDIKALTEKTPEERSQFVRTHSRSLSQSSRRSASSDGVDDDDDEPFSATEADVTPGPRPDLVSRRSQPGGRFPSDIQVNAQRGLLAPNSPSSVSSGPPEQSMNPEAVAIAAALPAAVYVAAGSGYGQDPESHMGYGGTEQTPMENMSSQAAIANEQAQYDGVNPYTSEPVQQQQQQQQSHSTNQDGGYFHPIIAQHDGQEPREMADTNVGNEHTRGLEGQGETREAESAEVNGMNYTQGSAEGAEGAEGAEHVNLAAGANMGSIAQPAQQRDSMLQAVPESEAAAHTTTGETPLTADTVKPSRPTDHRTDSTATISNLDIPGRYPRNSIVEP